MLPAIRNEAITTKQEIPYLYRYYDVFAYYQCSGLLVANEGLLQMANALTEAINKRNRLPQMIVIFMDKDVLESLGKSYIEENTYDAAMKLVTWYAKFVEQTINTQKEDLY